MISIKEINKRKNSINKTIADIKEDIYSIKNGEYKADLNPEYFAFHHDS